MKESISIDSLKIRIPLERVKIVNSCFGDTFQRLYSSGQLDGKKEFNKKKVIIKNGCTTNFTIGLNTKHSRGHTSIEECLYIGFNSKLLGTNYFDGIIKDNVFCVYQDLQKMKIVEFGFDTFLKSLCTDIDFKRDIIEPNFSMMVNELFSRAKPSKYKKYGVTPFNRIDNVGIEFNDRATTRTKTNPYLKLYQKNLELNSKSLEFNQTYLKGNFNKDLVRIETAIKNKRHLDSLLDIPDNSLKSILNLTSTQKEIILTSSLNANLQKRLSLPKLKTDMKPDKLIIARLFQSTMHFGGLTFEAVRTILMETLIDANMDRSNRRKKMLEIEEVYEVFIRDTETDIKSKEINAFFAKIGFSI